LKLFNYIYNHNIFQPGTHGSSTHGGTYNIIKNLRKDQIPLCLLLQNKPKLVIKIKNIMNCPFIPAGLGLGCSAGDDDNDSNGTSIGNSSPQRKRRGMLRGRSNSQTNINTDSSGNGTMNGYDAYKTLGEYMKSIHLGTLYGKKGSRVPGRPYVLISKKYQMTSNEIQQLQESRAAVAVAAAAGNGDGNGNGNGGGGGSDSSTIDNDDNSTFDIDNNSVSVSVDRCGDEYEYSNSNSNSNSDSRSSKKGIPLFQTKWPHRIHFKSPGKNTCCKEIEINTLTGRCNGLGNIDGLDVDDTSTGTTSDILNGHSRGMLRRQSSSHSRRQSTFQKITNKFTPIAKKKAKTNINNDDVSHLPLEISHDMNDPVMKGKGIYSTWRPYNNANDSQMDFEQEFEIDLSGYTRTALIGKLSFACLLFLLCSVRMSVTVFGL
jgi:hypothetical protein